MAVPSPVYVDANIIVGATVTKHALYKSAVRFLGETIASGTQILVSILTVEEALWALARISFCDLMRQPANARFTQAIYNRHRDRIFQNYGDRMEAIPSMLRDWTTAGIPITVVPQGDEGFLASSELIPRYMARFKLTPADAAHLALAEESARALATADGDFRRVPPNDPDDIPLEIVQIKA